MRLAFCVFLCAVNFYYQQCFALNFIDLPGFGSEEKLEDLGKESKQSTFKPNPGVPSDDSDSDKKEQNVEQSLESRKHGMEQENSSYTYEPKTQSIQLVTKTSLSTMTTTENSQKPYPPVRSSTTANYRRKWFVSGAREKPEEIELPPEDDKDENIKSKISMLVQQTMHDTEGRIKTVQKLKDRHRHEAPYRVGFILSMIKKSRDVLNELFNVAVKHRDEWKALEQLKIFELIVHTNVDTTNLVRQLVEMHIQNLNATAHNEQTTPVMPSLQESKQPARSFKFKHRAEVSPATVPKSSGPSLLLKLNYNNP